jgi:ABC-type multidrug transport system ATPase subunit
MIRIENVSKSFDCHDVLSNVSLLIGDGELVALLGPNGAGKSTLINCILGITGYDGKITVAGLDPLRQGPKLRGRIGFMPQQGSLHADLTLVETIDFYAAFRNIDVDAMELLEAVQLAEHADKRVGELSGGMQQRLAFAVARIGHPPVLLLDEPSASLDRESKKIMFTLLRQLVDDGVTVLLSTHLDSELAECADRFVVLENGRIVEQRGRSAA